MIGKKTSQEMVDRVIDLRMKGLSLKAICKGLKMSKSTVSGYINGLRKNNKYIDNGTSQIIKTRWNLKRQKVIEEAVSEFQEIRKVPEIMLFLGLYWGEGHKTNTTIGIANNDPNIIRVCHNIFKKLSPNKKMMIVIFCYPTHNKNICKKFWTNLLNEDVQIKNSTDHRSISYEHIHPRCLWGRCRLTYNHFEAYWRIMTWIKMLGENVSI